jgi:serine/threonine protein kinase
LDGVPTFSKSGPAITPPGSDPGQPFDDRETLYRPSNRETKEIPPGVDGYVLKTLLGRGQFGEVFLAEAPGGIPVAVKRMLHAYDDENSKRELESLELIKSLHHPYLLSTYAAWMQDNRLHIAMDLADGSLLDRFEECKRAGLAGIPAEELADYFLQAATALDFLHERNVIHRDVKPANLMRLQGFAKVADFGLARQQKADLDQTMRPSGTPSYMAPEIWSGSVTRHSDQYALAITYAEMRTGAKVFEGRDFFHLAFLHRDAEPNLAGLTPAEQKVLRKALAKDPAQRFPTCTAFARALNEAVRPQPVRPHRIPLGYFAASIGLGLILGVALFFFLPREEKTAEPTTLGKNTSGVPEPPKPPPMATWLPARFQSFADSKLVASEGRHYFDRLVSTDLPDLVLLLIRRRLITDPPTFYIMRDKVTNAQFRKAWDDPRMTEVTQRYRPAYLKFLPGKWRVHADEEGADSLPVVDVTVSEADAFARWLGGKLPSAQQWDAAGGRYDDAARGPLKGSWTTADGPLAIKPWTDRTVDGRTICRPLAVGTSPADVAPSGCRDMAGNGREFTRNLGRGRFAPLFPPDDLEFVFLRGGSFSASVPYQFDDDDDDGDITGYNSRQYDWSFRVVLEIPVDVDARAAAQP